MERLKTRIWAWILAFAVFLTAGAVPVRAVSDGRERAMPIRSESRAAESGEVSLNPFLTTVSFKKAEGSEFIELTPETQLKHGDEVRLSLEYTFGEGKIDELIAGGSLQKIEGPNGQSYYQFVYQLPQGLMPKSLPDQKIYKTGTTEVLGDLMVDADGTVHFKFYEESKAYISSSEFFGDFSYTARIDARSVEDGKLVFATAEGSMEFQVDMPDFGLNITKEGEFNIDLRPWGSAEYVGYGSELWQKYGQYANYYGVLSYKVTISPGENAISRSTIDFTDKFITGTSDDIRPAFQPDSLKLIHQAADGTKTQLNASDFNLQVSSNQETGQLQMTLRELPALEAGERYILTYEAHLTREEVTRLSASREAVNQAEAVSGSDAPVSSDRKVIPAQIPNWPEFDNLVHKHGRFDESRNAYEWLIFVNPKYQDLKNHTIKDKLPEGVGFASDISVYKEFPVSESDGQYEVGDSMGYNKYLTLPKPSGDTLEVKVPFTDMPDARWEKGEQKRYTEGRNDVYDDAFVIQFYTTSLGQGKTLKNKVDVVDNASGSNVASHTSSGVTDTSQPIQPSLQKIGWGGGYSSQGSAVADNQMKKKWEIRYNTGNLEDLSTLTFKDTLGNLQYMDEDPSLNFDFGPESHYALASELDAQLKDKRTGVVLKLRDPDQTEVRYNNDADGDGQNDYIDWSFRYFDKDDNEIPAADSTRRVQRFEIKMTAKKTGLQGLSFGVENYYTYMDLNKVTDEYFNRPVAVKNTVEAVETQLRAEDYSAAVIHKSLVKEIYTDNAAEKPWKKNKYAQTDDVQQNIKDRDVFAFRLIIPAHNPGEMVTLKDYLPAGMRYVEDSLEFEVNEFSVMKTSSSTVEGEKFTYFTKSDQYRDYQPSSLQVDYDESTGVLTISFKSVDLKAQEDRILISYAVSVADDSFWKTAVAAPDSEVIKKVYQNRAVVDEGTDKEASGSRKLTVFAERPKLSKTAGWKSDRIAEYRIPINPGAQDLDSEKDTLKFEDVLKLQDANARAALIADTVKLYAYTGDISVPGEEIPKSDYTVKYTESADGTHKLTLEIPDERALLLVYQYNVDPMDTAGEFKVDNEATLYGNKSNFETHDSQVMDSAASASGQAMGMIKLYKMDQKNNAVLIPGTSFELASYKAGSWTKIAEKQTNADGVLLLDPFEASYTTATLYRLKETKAAAGYQLGGETLYFVWAPKDTDSHSTAELMKLNGDWDETLEEQDVNIFRLHGGFLYLENIPDESTPTQPDESTPTEPDESTPTEPDESVKPTVPDESTPTEPEESVKPTVPDETAPTEPEESVKPTVPDETTPTEPEESVKPTVPDETAPTEPDESVKPTVPNESTPTEPDESVKPTVPDETTPTEPEESVKPTVPDKTAPTESDESVKPTVPDKSVETGEPDESDETASSERPTTEPAESAKPTKPAESLNPSAPSQNTGGSERETVPETGESPLMILTVLFTAAAAAVTWYIRRRLLSAEESED